MAPGTQPGPTSCRCYRLSFDHERLDVYQAALDFVVLCEDVLEQLPRGRAHLVEQLSRASTSIVLNIAEVAVGSEPSGAR
jgi:23S rRNA-intervening sequence protein